eukprot:GFYU01050358.1.p1 GENE.GFYU01050358.1~~GFYU01050358.1.p1  ORF type:complete len:188 (+),score=18.07 GFYU01050358.1:34-597(+)
MSCPTLFLQYGTLLKEYCGHAEQVSRILSSHENMSSRWRAVSCLSNSSDMGVLQSFQDLPHLLTEKHAMSLERLSQAYNTAIARLMEIVNQFDEIIGRFFPMLGEVEVDQSLVYGDGDTYTSYLSLMKSTRDVLVQVTLVVSMHKLAAGEESSFPERFDSVWKQASPSIEQLLNIHESLKKRSDEDR